MTTPGWTIDDLVEQVAGALADGYGGQASGRVRDLPDRRAVRWYQTLGLVDRPAGWRGRTALYGRRHLLQLTAIKRLQAAGRTLADIQVELAGAGDARLRQLAGMASAPEDQAPAAAPRRAGGDGDRRFWSTHAAAPAPAGGDGPPTAPGTARAWHGIQLGEGVILLLDRVRPGATPDDDLRDLQAAAAPLLAALRDRGLAPTARPAAAPPPERTDAP